MGYQQRLIAFQDNHEDFLKLESSANSLMHNFLLEVKDP